MPPPMSRYHFSVLSYSGVRPAACQSRSSAAWVPLLVAARHEGCLGRRDGLESDNAVVAAGDTGRVARGADDDEIIPRNLSPCDAMSLVDEFCSASGS